MLKSTYNPTPGLSPPQLPPGWTEHKAPTGHTYYYNASTGESTYRRPAAAPTDPSTSFMQHQALPAVNLSNPAAANAFMAQYAPTRPPPPTQQPRHQRPTRPQPVDRPRARAAIPGCEPWVLVYTKYGRRFAYNPAKNASFWRIPDKLKPGILELDQARIRQKAEGHVGEKEGPATVPRSGSGEESGPRGGTELQPEGYDSDEYEEVEVTDDDDEGEEEGSAPKRQRTEDPGQEDGGPVEFTEADIMAQLQAMEAEAGEEGEEGEDEGEQGLELSDADARELFKDLLNDFGINPYSPWEKLIEEGRVFDDARYAVLGTTKARRDVWEEWSRDKIRQLKEQRARQEKTDPRIAYMVFLQQHATPRLYWPEFRRKHRKEPPMRDPGLSDKDRERWYREHVARLKLPPATLKADLRALLESVPPARLHNRTNPSHLPAQVVTDLRYISLDPPTRDPIVEAYIQALGPPPPEEDGGEAGAAGDDAARKEREKRRRRERALEERDRAVAEERRRQERRLTMGRARLRDEELELERAMQVGKKGLQSQLAGDGRASRGE